MISYKYYIGLYYLEISSVSMEYFLWYLIFFFFCLFYMKSEHHTNIDHVLGKTVGILDNIYNMIS